MKYYRERIELDMEIPAKIYLQKGQHSNNTYPLHWHSNLEFNLVLKGQINGKIAGQNITVNEDDIFFVNSDELHETDAEPGCDINAVTILLSKKILKEYCPQIDDYYFDISNPIIKSEIKSIILKCATVFEEKNDFYKLELSYLLRQLCLVLLRNCRRKRIDADTNKFERENMTNIKSAINYMEQNYENSVTLNDIAGEIGMSPNYFSRFFKKTTGETFYSFLNRIRVFHAENDLLNTDKSVTEIAFENGFPNTKSFIEMFKKVHNQTPAKYRRLKSRLLNNT